MYYESSSERRAMGKPFGEDFVPLSETPDI
jgi:hypothetical protein